MTGYLPIGSDISYNVSVSYNVNASAARRSSKTEAVGSRKDFKLERIITKFRTGKKLTSGELSYLAEKAPEIYQKVLRIMQRREQLEKRLEQAGSKEEVQMIMMEEMQSAVAFCNNSDDDFEKESLVNQLMDAYNEAVGADTYREKPDTNRELWEEIMPERGIAAGLAWPGEGEESLAGTEAGEGTEAAAALEGLGDTGGAESLAGRGDGEGSESLSSWEAPGNGEALGNGGARVTYTARGAKSSAGGTTGKKGRRINVAI